MKLFILCLRSLSGAAMLSRIVLPTLSCRSEGCTSSGGLDEGNHILERSVLTRVSDIMTTNAIAKRNSKNIDLLQKTDGHTKQQVSLPNSQTKPLSPSSDHSKATSPSKIQGASTKIPGAKQPHMQAPSKQGTESVNPVRQHIKKQESNQGGGIASKMALSKQSKLTDTSGSRNLQSSSSPNTISSKSSPDGTPNLNLKHTVQPKLSPNKATQSAAKSMVSRSGVTSSGKESRTQINTVAKTPTGKAHNNIPGQQSGKREKSGPRLPGMDRNMQAKATSRSLTARKKAISGHIAQADSIRGQSSWKTAKKQGQSSQLQGGKKKLCRRGDERRFCDPPAGDETTFRVPKPQTMEDRRTRKKMEDQLATQASLDLRKARNSKNSNRLTTGVLGTGLASSITGTSATMPGLCCHGMACGSAHL